MLKNKIYNYFFKEILKNFLTILFTFSLIAWVVRAVNFLDLMVEDGYGSIIYLKYSLLSITTIVSRFVPLAFLLSLTISIAKFERQQELLILWTSGLSKVKIINIFILIGVLATLFQLILSTFVNPFLLNKSRQLLSNENSLQINTILKSNDFSDAFLGVTFHIGKKNEEKELQNIFIKDDNGNLNNIVSTEALNQNTTIIANKGYVDNGKLILFDGILQTLNKKKEIKNFQFEKTELSLLNMATRTIKQAKIQETSTRYLLNCVFNLNSCSNNYKNEATQTIARRVGTPMYILLISVITSFLLIYKKKKTYNFLKKYILFIFSFMILVFAEIFLQFTSNSVLFFGSYFAVPLIVFFLFYLILLKKLLTEKIIK